MKCYLDTNFLLYLTDPDSPFHQKAISVFECLVLKSTTLYISPLILDEFIYQFRKYILVRSGPKGVYIELDRVLGDILSIPNLKIVNSPVLIRYQKEIIKFMEKFNLRPRDAYHLLTMRYNKVEYFLTFDNDFKKVFKAKLVLPAREII